MDKGLERQGMGADTGVQHEQTAVAINIETWSVQLLELSRSGIRVKIGFCGNVQLLQKDENKTGGPQGTNGSCYNQAFVLRRTVVPLRVFGQS